MPVHSSKEKYFAFHFTVIPYSKIQARFYADLRSRIINFQRFARGYLTRKAYQKQKDAVVTIQAGVRMYIAKKECRRLREERAKFLEAERIKKLEEEKLMKQMNAKKAREEAERLHLQRLDQMRLEKEAKDKMEKEQMLAKRAHIEDAEKRRNQDVDDSKMVDEVFGFLPGDSDGGGAGGGGGGQSGQGGADAKGGDKPESGPSLFRDLEDKRQQVSD